jgi:hypothetical protein
MYTADSVEISPLESVLWGLLVLMLVASAALHISMHTRRARA